MGQADRRDHARIKRITKALFKADLDAVTGIGAELLTPFLSNYEDSVGWRTFSNGVINYAVSRMGINGR